METGLARLAVQETEARFEQQTQARTWPSPHPPIALSPQPTAKVEAERMAGENCAEQLLLAPLYLHPFFLPLSVLQGAALCGTPQ